MASKYNLMINIGGKLNKSLSNATNGANRALSGMQKRTNLLKAAIVGAVGYVSVNSVVNFGKACVSAAEDQIDAETKLKAVLQNVNSIQAKGPEAYKASAKVLEGVASNLQKVGVIGDEVTLSGMQQLATFQMSDDQISVLSTGMTDLLAQQKGLNATQEDAVNIANMIGKAMDGNVGALSRVGISFTDAQAEAIKTGDATQRAATIAEVLENNVGGVNAALADTDQGKIQQVTNAWNDMKEKIGSKLLPVIASVMTTINDKLPAIESKIAAVSSFIETKVKPVIAAVVDFVKAHMSTIKAVVGTALGIIKGAIIRTYTVIKGIVNFISDHVVLFETIAGAILAVVAAMLIWKGVIMVISGVTKAFAIVQGVLNAVMAANPIVLIILAIVALVAAFVILWHKCDAFRNFWINLWDGIKNVVSGIGEWFGTVFTGAWEAIKGAFSSVGSFFQGIWDTITSMFTAIGTTVGNAIGGAFAAVVNAIINFAENTINGFISAINLAISLINAIPGVNISPLAPLAIPRLAEGGIIQHQPGGILANIGEGKYDEAVIPLKKGTSLGGGSNVTYAPVQNFYGPVNKADVEEANAVSFREFKAWYKKMKDEERRKSFVPV